MSNQIEPRLAKWPFLIGDALLVGLAYFLCSQSAHPMGFRELFACVLCVALGAALAVLPFLAEHRAVVRLLEADKLATTVSQIKNLEQLAAQIGYATSQWQIVRESSDRTASMAKEIAQGMAAEVKSFNEFLQRTNEDEKSALRLEVDKLRRAEGDWLQVLVRMLDHVYALHQAALRSRQPGLIEQLGSFQNACRDVARRVGLAPFSVAAAEPFDQQRHQLVDTAAKPPPGATVEETIATGYTFQGKLIRPAVVRLRNGDAPHIAGGEASNATDASASVSGQSRLPLESA
jgi:molecular chaperone GrpE (heat shock protein)